VRSGEKEQSIAEGKDWQLNEKYFMDEQEEMMPRKNCFFRNRSLVVFFLTRPPLEALGD
jgi:hypothetical protein